MRPSRSLGVLAALVASTAAAGAVGCGSSSAPAVTVGPNGVLAKNLAFTPSKLSVKVGDTVTWTFADGPITHNVDGSSDLAALNSGALQAKGNYSFLFTKPGTYTYHCDNHPNMIGTVTVS